MLNRFVLCIALLLVFTFSFGQNIQKTLQTQLILAEDGDTIHLPTGLHSFNITLSLDEKKNLVIQGAGENETILDFSAQKDGAEGLRVSNCQNIVLSDFSVKDTRGDAIKVQNTDQIVFRRLKTYWSGKPGPDNGAYGLYPVSCKRVLIEYCTAEGASDAGIYVGQSEDIVVRNCTARYNVAGIEIENSERAEVYNCLATQNTGGILVFDLPDLPKKRGGHVRIYENMVVENNHKNFAPKGNIVGTVPPGTGILVLAASDVEIHKNVIRQNKTVGTGIISYFITEEPIKDSAYYPYPQSIYIHDNTYEREKGRPTLKNRLGVLFYLKFGRKVPDIIFDGILDEKNVAKAATPSAKVSLCIQNNGGATFANLDAANKFKNIRRDLSDHNCACNPLLQPRLDLR